VPRSRAKSHCRLILTTIPCAPPSAHAAHRTRRAVVHGLREGVCRPAAPSGPTQLANCQELEKHSLARRMQSGAAVGSTAAFPVIWTLMLCVAAPRDRVFFLRRRAVYVLAVAAVYGIPCLTPGTPPALVFGGAGRRESKPRQRRRDLVGPGRTSGAGCPTGAATLPLLRCPN